MRGLIRWNNADRERGSMSVLTVLFLVSVLAVLGLVVDAGDKARAARLASFSATEAARAGGQNPGNAEILGRASGVDTAAAAAAARSYLTQAGVTGTVRVSGDTLTVTTSVPWQPRIYTVLPGKTMTATASAALRRT